MKRKRWVTILLAAIAMTVSLPGNAKERRPDSGPVVDSVRELAARGDAAGIRDLCYRYLSTKRLKDSLTEADYKCREMIGLLGARTGDLNDVYESLVFFASHADEGHDYAMLADTLAQRYLELVEKDQREPVSEGWYVSTQCDKKGRPELMAHIYREPAGWRASVIEGCRLADDADNVSVANILETVPLTTNWEGATFMAVFGGEKFDGANEGSAQMMGMAGTSLYNSGMNAVSNASSFAQIGTGTAVSALGIGMMFAAQSAAQSAKVTQRVIALRMDNNHDGTMKVGMTQLSRLLYADRTVTDTLHRELTLVKLYPHNSGLLYSKPLKSIVTYRGLMAMKDKKAVSRWLQLFHPCATQEWVYRVYKKEKFPLWSLVGYPALLYTIPKHFADKHSTASKKKNHVMDMKNIDLGRLNKEWYRQWAWEAYFNTGEEGLDHKASYLCRDDGSILLGRLKKDGTPKKNSKLYTRTKEGIISCDTIR